MKTIVPSISNGPFSDKSFLSNFALASPLPVDIDVSFEFFPPDTDQSNKILWSSIQRLAPLNPSFVSVTYGAGGTTRERTHNTVSSIIKETQLETAAHLTCVNATREEVDNVARQYRDAGVNHIIALRGDPPKGTDSFYSDKKGYISAADLVTGLKKIANFQISVAAYPEPHPEASSPEADLDNLKRKIDAGATQAITQYFFNVDTYLRFLERARTAGITVPIIPGILPVTNFKRVFDFSKRCGADIPLWMADLFTGLDDEPEARKLVAASLAAEQCRVLNANGVNQFHFYTMNRADLCFAICHMLGVRPKSKKSLR
jgi:methylenetetrahydrofolate reductase (NADPH)|tara:strand:+ start:120 stop:1070 length:951 start_codon:yes stop_codon:yes gene_type:complete